MKGDMQTCRALTFESSTSRDLVLTLMHRGNFNYIAPFILSLKRTGFRGSTAVFTSNVDKECIEQLQDCGVIVVPFRFTGREIRQPLSRAWPLWRWFFSTSAPRAAKMWLAHAVFHLYYRRHLVYLEFLDRHVADFDRVLLADCKDVFFQSDPFAWDWTPGVHFFLEEPAHRIGDCPVHREWFRRLFGPSFIESHAQNIPACAGTTFGDMAGIRQYLDLMVTTTMQAVELDKLFGGDQGVHNYILLEKLLTNVIVHENGCGPVLTMKMMDESDWQVDAQGAVRIGDGILVPVLHQYDCFPALKARLVSSLETVSQIPISDAVPSVVRAGEVVPARSPSPAINAQSAPRELNAQPLAPAPNPLPG